MADIVDLDQRRALKEVFELTGLPDAVEQARATTAALRRFRNTIEDLDSEKRAAMIMVAQPVLPETVALRNELKELIRLLAGAP